MSTDPGHFKILAPFYERVVKPKPPEKILSNLDLPAGGAVLDAAGGTGRVAQFLAQESVQVVVVDQTFQMLQEAKKKAGVDPVNALTERMPFQDGTFCCIIMVDALHHVADQAATIQELWRLLKPGGRIIIEEPDVRQFKVKIWAVLEKLAFMRSHLLTPTQVLRLFPFPNASHRVEVEDWTAWMIIEKGLPLD